MSRKPRLDALLVSRGLVATRSRAADLVRRGAVHVDGENITKPGKPTAPQADLKVDRSLQPYVSRAGLKLAAALDAFAIGVKGKTALDIGASTGGFTDVLLRRGAAHVFALDAGHGQLAEQLNANKRVTSLERLNARDLRRAHIPAPIDLVVCDVSFISLKKALPPALALCRRGAELVALIKPQFEAGRGNIGKGGIIRDTGLHGQICDGIRRWLEADMGWTVAGIIPSPITGADGNAEFLIAARSKLG